uniref:Protein phosphatase 1 regulatory subunit n=1 Tax=Xiphophorus couchianus TaxID=32473 RepID=A0A3B5L8V0_9TELE
INKCSAAGSSGCRSLLKTPFPIMPVDMAIRICLASSPPLRSFLRCCDSSPRKSVAFADSQGLALTTVYVFTEDDPLAELQFHLTELEEPVLIPTLISGLVLDFTPPATDYLDLRNRLKAQQVCLETCSVQDHLLSGTVQVRNIFFEKSVSVRITFDSWSSFQDVRCRYLNNVYGCPDIDTFTFAVPLPPDLVPSSRVEFCIWYQTKDQVHWDNNLGNNYRLNLLSKGSGHLVIKGPLTFDLVYHAVDYRILLLLLGIPEQP